jgi:hypothetical protein
MSGVLQGALGGGRALLIGWFLPSLMNILVFGFVIVPQLSGFQALASSSRASAARSTGFALAGTLVLGLSLAALQTPLYRILEGYLGWPEWLFQVGRRRMLSRKHLLQNRLDAADLALREAAGNLPEGEAQVLSAFRSHPVTGRFTASDARRGPVWLNLLEERLDRFPSGDEQVNATLLGNAIRRFEEYGYDRFLFDSQVLWQELYAVVPDPVRKQTEDARANVDFFVCLLYGHLLVAAAALIDFAVTSPAKPLPLLATIIGLPLLAVVWYRVSVVATDDWAGSVRALVNLGRQPLAASMGLELPKAIIEERRMWSLAVEFVRNPYSPEMNALDEYRSVADVPAEESRSAAIAEGHSSPVRVSARRKRLRR